jgi:hypothetical protein
MKCATGPVSPGRRRPAHQAVADLVELRRAQRRAEPLREPGDEMRLLVGTDLHGVAHFGRVGHVRDRRAPRHRRAGVGYGRAARLEFPSGQRAEQEGDDHPPGGKHVAAPPGPRTNKLRRERLGDDRVVDGAQFLRQPAIVGNALGFFGASGKPRFDRHAALGLEPAVGVRLEVCLGDRRFAHFTSFSFAAAADWPSIIVRSFSRARDSRDITVPIGTSSVRATSS